MENILHSLQVKINDKIFLKDPENSELGKKILKEGHRMLDEMGFEGFTFKKLAQKLLAPKFKSKIPLLLVHHYLQPLKALQITMLNYPKQQSLIILLASFQIHRMS